MTSVILTSFEGKKQEHNYLVKNQVSKPYNIIKLYHTKKLIFLGKVVLKMF